MPVLLLAHGDQTSKTLLRRAIEARYGLGPPAIETLKIEFTGRSRVRIGPLAVWLPLQGFAYFKFPIAARWDYRVRSLGMSLSSGIDSFSQDTCYKKRGGAAVQTSRETARVSSAQARIAALNAIFLTPLTEDTIELRAADETTLDARSDANETSVRLILNPDFTLAAVTTDCFNPASSKPQRFSVRFENGQVAVDDLILPRAINVAWDDEPLVSLVPTAAEINPPLSDDLFRLENLPLS